MVEHFRVRPTQNHYDWSGLVGSGLGSISQARLVVWLRFVPSQASAGVGLGLLFARGMPPGSGVQWGAISGSGVQWEVTSGSGVQWEGYIGQWGTVGGLYRAVGGYIGQWGTVGGLYRAVGYSGRLYWAVGYIGGRLSFLVSWSRRLRWYCTFLGPQLG